MKIKTQIIFLLFIAFNSQLIAQFSQGLDKNEANDLMKLAYYPFRMEKDGDSLMKAELPNYKIIKTVDSVAMDNAWSVIKKDDIGIVTFRGTTSTKISWLENYYSAMIPAKGEITLPSGEIVNYIFAQDERAGVQTGWSLAILIMYPEIIDEIKKLNSEGIFNIYLAGHSQGGVLTLLFRTFLENLPESVLSKKNQYKTYAFAAPKPGNRFYSYEYNKICNANLSSFTFINPYDWVPQTPFSVQSPNNVSNLNPFVEFENSKEGSLLKRSGIHHIYNSIKNPILKSQKKINKTLGDRVSSLIMKDIGEFKVPEYMLDAAYFPVGVTIMLEQFKPSINPDDKSDAFWQHHSPHYIKLINDYFEEN